MSRTGSPDPVRGNVPHGHHEVAARGRAGEAPAARRSRDTARPPQERIRHRTEIRVARRRAHPLRSRSGRRASSPPPRRARRRKHATPSSIAHHLSCPNHAKKTTPGVRTDRHRRAALGRRHAPALDSARGAQKPGPAPRRAPHHAAQPVARGYDGPNP